MPQSSQGNRVQNIHLPLVHRALYAPEIAAELDGLMGAMTRGAPLAVGIDLRPEDGLRPGSEIWAWHLAADPAAPARMHVVAGPVQAAPLAVRRAAGAAWCAVFGAAELDRYAEALAGLIPAGAGLWHLICFPGGAMLVDAALRDRTGGAAGPMALRRALESELGRRVVMIRDSGAASAPAATELLVGLDRVVKTLLPGYMRGTPDPMLDAALEDVRFLPRRAVQGMRAA